MHRKTVLCVLTLDLLKQCRTQDLLRPRCSTRCTVADGTCNLSRRCTTLVTACIVPFPGQRRTHESTYMACVHHEDVWARRTFAIESQKILVACREGINGLGRHAHLVVHLDRSSIPKSFCGSPGPKKVLLPIRQVRRHLDEKCSLLWARVSRQTIKSTRSTPRLVTRHSPKCGCAKSGRLRRM